MKTALWVLAAGLVLLSVAVLRTARSGGSSATPSPDDRRAAVEAVKTLGSLTAHYRSGGDPRFLERIPASPTVLDEIRRGREFALHLGTVEEVKTVRLDIADVRRVAQGRLEVDVTEYRVTRTASAGGATGVRSDVVRTRYLVARLPGGWTIVDLAYAPLMTPPQQRGG